MNAILGICKGNTNKWFKLRNKCFKDCDFTYWASNLKVAKFHFMFYLFELRLQAKRNKKWNLYQLNSV